MFLYILVGFMRVFLQSSGLKHPFRLCRSSVVKKQIAASDDPASTITDLNPTVKVSNELNQREGERQVLGMCV